MYIYLLRHGPARDRAEHDGSDSSRRLTSKGRSEVREVAKAMRGLKIRPGLIFSSPYLRALETAEIVRDELALEKACLVQIDNLKPGAEYGDLVAELRRYAREKDEILLVGHEPDLSEFTSLLISGSPEGVLCFKKTGLAKVECGELRAGRCGHLCWLVTPKLIQQ